jgi:ribosomal protein L37AE/L43A
MKQELEDKLTKKFPFYTKYNKWFGFECEDGWYEMLNEMSEKIQEVIKNNNFHSFGVFQVKEKFGSLRYYTMGSIPEIDEIIDEYEEKSCHICEVCGKTGTIRNISKYWLKCVCDEDFYERSAI